MTENELMLTSLRNCRRVDLYADPKPLTENQQQMFVEFQDRRQIGEPLQYILGESEFMGCRLKVDTRVLIPRPETERLVESVLEHARRVSSFGIRILDIGTGSGNIAIALAKYLPKSLLTAVDFSQGCLDLASLNAKMNSVFERVQFFKDDLFPSKNLCPKFDILVSNPPYIPSDAIGDLPLEVQFEPRAALDGGRDGLDFYRRIFRQCPEYLNQGGSIFLEIGCNQTQDLKHILKAHPFLRLMAVKKDLCSRDRILILRIV